jgi:enoyl-CoA hydratase/carnithine racemase
VLDLDTIRVARTGPVAVARIDNPPVNLLDERVLADLREVIRWLEGDDAVKVCIFESANPEFFICHYDVQLLLGEGQRRTLGAGPFNLLMERIRALPQLTIGKVDGAARGGGSELLLALDVRYGSLENAVFGQPEVALGLIPGGGATQRLTALVGRARALELVVGGGDLRAAEAESWGYLNRAVPAAELDRLVEDLARRVASFPGPAIAAAKHAINAAEVRNPEGFSTEAVAFESVKVTNEARRRMTLFLESGGQTAEVERDLTAEYAGLAERDDDLN